MMTISASGIGRIDVGVNSSTDVKKSEENATDLFSAIMDMKNNTSVNTSEQTAPIKTAKNDSTNNSVDYKSTKDDVKYSNITKSNTKTESKINTNPKDDSLEELPEDVISSMVQQVKEILVDSLNIDENDLKAALEELGLSEQDLLNFDNLKGVALYLQGASEVDMLISEDLENLISDLQDKLDTVLENVDSLKTNVEEDDITDAKTLDSTSINPKSSTANSDSINNELDVQNNESIVDIVYSENAGSDNNTDSKNDDNSIIANLAQSLEQVTENQDVDTIVPFSDNVSQADVLRQVVDAVRVNISKDNTSMTLQLNPENLGKVQISVNNRNGVMQAQIIAESEAAKRAIETNLELLKQSFEHQDLRVESVEVTIASYDFFGQATGEEFEQNSEPNSSRRTGNISISDDVEELTDDEELQISVMKAQGNSVSYSI